jgi:hypothetical protein
MDLDSVHKGGTDAALAVFAASEDPAEEIHSEETRVTMSRLEAVSLNIGPSLLSDRNLLVDRSLLDVQNLLEVAMVDTQRDSLFKRLELVYNGRTNAI